MKKGKLIAFLILVILVIIEVKLIFSSVVNEIFIAKYNNGNYSENMLKPLYWLNFPESCNVYYNHGNVFFKENNFDLAIEKYKKALELFPSKNKECKIRINLCLAMLKKINFDNVKEEEIDNILNDLENAKEVLLVHGCANRNDYNGHNKDAEQLKKEIEDMEDMLKNQKQNDEENFENEENTDENNKDEQKDETAESNEIEEKLKEIRQQGTESRQEEIEKRKMIQNYSFYSGKKW